MVCPVAAGGLWRGRRDWGGLLQGQELVGQVGTGGQTGRQAGREAHQARHQHGLTRTACPPCLHCSGWGEGGYIRLQRAKPVYGGQCGLLLAASYPNFSS